MSVHTKKRVPLHKHFEDEVVGAKNVRPNRPAHKGVHASDVVIDSVLTLAETLIQWIRYLEDVEFTLLAGTTRVVDSYATDGYAAKRPSTAGSGSMWFGSYIPFESGTYYAIFKLKVASNVSSSNVLTVDVYSDAGGGVLASRTIKPNDFPASNRYHHFAIKFEIQGAPVTDLEFRGVSFVTGITDVYMDFVGIVPAHIPLDFADVDVTDADAIDGLVDGDAITSVDEISSDGVVGYTSSAVASQGVNDQTWTTMNTLTAPASDVEFYVVDCDVLPNSHTSSFMVKVRVYDATDAVYYPTSNGVERNVPSNDSYPSFQVLITLPANVNGHSLQCQIWHSKGSAHTFWMRNQGWGHSRHEHDHTEYSPSRGQTGHTEFSPQHGQTGASDLGHEH